MFVDWRMLLASMCKMLMGGMNPKVDRLQMFYLEICLELRNGKFCYAIGICSYSEAVHEYGLLEQVLRHIRDEEIASQENQ